MSVCIYFIRHGESEANVFDKLTHNVYDRLMKLQCFSSEIDTMLQDPCLTINGIMQSKMCGDKISKVKFDSVLCSPLFRAIQSAAYIFEYNSCKIELCIQAREIEWDCYECKGRLLKDIENGIIPNSNSRRPRLDDLPNGKNKFENLESIENNSMYWNPKLEETLDYEELKIKMHENIQNFYKLLEKYENKTIAVVCHGNLISELLKIHYINNCQIVKCSYSKVCGFNIKEIIN